MEVCRGYVLCIFWLTCSTCQRPGPSIPKGNPANPALLGGEKKLDPSHEIREFQLYM